MNLCKDCKHFTAEAASCLATKINLVTGESDMNADSCYTARKLDGRCGLEGRLFETVELIETTATLIDPSGKQPDVIVKVRKPRGPNKPKVTAETEAKDGQGE